MPAEQSIQGLAQNAEQAGRLVNTPEFAWSGYFEAMGILFAILATLWLAVWLLKKRQGQKATKATSELHIENRLPIDAKRWLLVVQFKGKHLLLGVTEQNISTLACLDEEQPEKQTSSDAKILRQSKGSPAQNTAAQDNLLSFDPLDAKLELKDFDTVLRGERVPKK